MRIIHIFYISSLLVIMSCKSTKQVVTNTTTNTDITTQQIINTYNGKRTKFNTLVGKLDIEYIQDEKSQSYTISLRMQKDSVIWISKLGIVKALITPNRVQYYNKLEGEFFDGDFSLLSQFLGVDITFKQLQNLLLGEAIIQPKNDTFTSNIEDDVYLLFPKTQAENFELFMLLNPSYYKMQSQQIAQLEHKRLLQVDYKTYQHIDTEILPKAFTIFAIEATKETKINLELKSIKLNENLRFPFKIPSGYDEIILD